MKRFTHGLVIFKRALAIYFTYFGIDPIIISNSGHNKSFSKYLQAISPRKQGILFSLALYISTKRHITDILRAFIFDENTVF